MAEEIPLKDNISEVGFTSQSSDVLITYNILLSQSSLHSTPVCSVLRQLFDAVI